MFSLLFFQNLCPGLLDSISLDFHYKANCVQCSLRIMEFWPQNNLFQKSYYFKDCANFKGPRPAVLLLNMFFFQFQLLALHLYLLELALTKRREGCVSCNYSKEMRKISMQILGLKPSLLRKFIWHQKERNELAEPWKEDTKAGMNTVYSKAGCYFCYIIG